MYVTRSELRYISYIAWEAAETRPSLSQSWTERYRESLWNVDLPESVEPKLHDGHRHLLDAIRTGVDTEESRAERRRIDAALSRVYFICRGQQLKIGYSCDVQRQLELQSSGKFMGCIPGGRSVKRNLADRFSSYKADCGGDWFDLEPELQTQLDKILSEKRTGFFTLNDNPSHFYR